MTQIDETATSWVHKSMPFAERLGIEVLEGAAELVRTRLAWDGTLCTAGETMHGGALMALADATAGVCGYLALPAGATGTTTIESKTNFLRPIRAGYAVASSRPLHTGRRVMVIETEIHDDGGALAAKVTQTQAVL